MLFLALLLVVTFEANIAQSLPTIFSTKAALQTAVDTYCSNSANAEAIYGEIGAWDVSQITDMSSLFQDKNNCNPPIGSWDVSNVTTMERMFYISQDNPVKSSTFNQDIGNWDVSKVTSMALMFQRAYRFNQDISGWDVSKVTTMQNMFNEAYVFNQDITGWDVSKVTFMQNMFNKAYVFNQDIGIWDVSSVKNMQAMFSQANAFNQDINAWDVSSVTTMRIMFASSGFRIPLCWDVTGKDITGWSATRSGTCTPTATPTTVIPSTAMPTTVSPTTSAPTTATRCMAGYMGDITPYPNTCSAVITTADVADVAEAEDVCAFHGGALDLSSFTAAGSDFTCISDPIPFSHLYDRMVETEHPYINGQTELYTVALPNIDCYKLWFDMRSEIAASSDFVRVFQYRYRRRGREDGRKRLEPQLRNQFSRFSTQETGFHVDGDYLGLQLVADDNRRNFGFIAYISSCPAAA